MQDKLPSHKGTSFIQEIQDIMSTLNEAKVLYLCEFIDDVWSQSKTTSLLSITSIGVMEC